MYKPYSIFRSWLYRLSKAMALVSAFGLVAIMLLLVADISLRYLFNKPITGNWELVGTLLVLSTCWGLTYCHDKKGHVKIEVIADRLPRLGKKIVRILDNLIGLAGFLIMCWQAVLLTIKYFTTEGRMSETLHIPTGYLMLILVLGSGLFVIKLLCELIDSVEETMLK